MSYEEGIRLLVDRGYRFGLASNMVADTLQPRLREYEGYYAVDDPQDNEDGFVLRGDDPVALVAEAVEYVAEMDL